MDRVQSLRRYDFPECAKLALDQLANLLVQGNQGIPGLGAANEDVVEQVVSEFIFGLTSVKLRQHRKLNSLQELQLGDVILQFFAQHKDEATRHSLFKAVFSRCCDSEQKVSVLTKVVSMAVGVQNSNLLNSAAVWMQSQGCNSDVVLNVMESLIQDYCELAPDGASTLKDLPRVSPHFTCTMITAIICIYSLPEESSKRPIISSRILEQIIDWMSFDCRLALTSIHQTQYIHSQRPTLWTSPTKPNTQTPIPGLVRWCTRVPLLIALQHSRTDEKSVVQNTTNELHSSAHLWTKLHFCILQTILQFPTIPGAPQLELITLADMTAIVKDVSVLVQRLQSCQATEVAVDRLVQVLQVALATGAFRCSIGDLRVICQTIPPCRLLTIVQNQHLSFAPPPMHNAS